LDHFGLVVRNRTKCSVVLATVDGDAENTKKITERIGLVSERMKDGILLLLRFGTYRLDKLTTFMRKTIIVTGNK